MVTSLVGKGGKVDRFYLRDLNKNKKALVYLNGWITGKNIREALEKALEPKV